MKKRAATAPRGANRRRALVDVTRPPAGPAEGEAALRELRAALANLRAAAEAMAVAAAPARPARRRSGPADPPQELLAVVVEEAGRASRALERLALAGKAAGGRESGSDSARRLAAEIVRRARAELGIEVEAAREPAVDSRILVAAGPIVSAVLGALARLRRDYAVASVELSLRRHEGLVALDLAFRAREPEASRLRQDHAELLAGGPSGEPPLGETARSAGGEAWVAVRRSSATLALRVLLPVVPAPA